MSKILHSQILGEGEPLVIIHGFLGSGDNWITLGRKWAGEGFEVHLVDMRNHGRSFWDDSFTLEDLTEDLLNYIHHYGLENPHLLGHSLGGKVVMYEAVTSGYGKGKSIVADIAPKTYPSHHGFIFDALKNIDLSQVKTRQEVDELLKPYIPQKAIRQFVMKNLKRTPKGFAWKINVPVLEKSMAEVGQGLPPMSIYEGDILFIKGEKSPYIQLPEDEKLIKAHFPKAIIETIPGTGHWLHAEKPEEFYRLVTGFLKQEKEG